MIVDCAVYEDGRRRLGDLNAEEAARLSSQEGVFAWIGIHDPTHQEFESISQAFDLHELAVEDAIKAHQRPKIDDYGDLLFIVLKTVRYRELERQIETGDILLFVSENFVVSVRHGEASNLHPVRARLEARSDLLRAGPAAVVYSILDQVVDDYPPALESIDNDIGEVEAEVFSDSRAQPTELIYKLKREVLEFHRSVVPLIEPLDRLSNGSLELVPDSLRNYFRDVYDHCLRSVSVLESFRELLTSILQANFTQVNIRQNEDMRKISAWVAILAVPTMIAGLYGMNFDHMPELEWQLGYPLVLLVIAVICSLLYWRFRRAGWL